VIEDQYAEIEAFLKFKNYPSRQKSPIIDHKKWLREYLFNRGGSAPAAEVTLAAEECGIQINDLNALVHSLNRNFGTSWPEGYDGRCWWILKA